MHRVVLQFFIERKKVRWFLKARPFSFVCLFVSPAQVLFVNDRVDVDDEEGGEVDDSSLLRGYFDEEESARSFQEALKEWREKGRTGGAFRPGPTPARPGNAHRCVYYSPSTVI